jgi:hypothetical protein
MNRPSPSDRMLGRRGGGVVFAGLAVYSIYLWANQAAPWFVPLLVIVLGRYAHQARQRVEAYRTWSHAWNEMAGIPPGQQGAGKRRRQRSFNAIAGPLVWLCLGAWLIANPQGEGTSRYAVLALLFVIFSAWGAGAALLAALRWLRRLGASPARTSAKDAREHIVTVVPAIPRTSPGLGAIRAALPAYALELLSRQGDARPQQAAPPEQTSSH